MNIVEEEQEAARAELLAALEEDARARAKVTKAMQRCHAAKISMAEIARMAVISRPTVSDRLKAAGSGESPSKR